MQVGIRLLSAPRAQQDGSSIILQEVEGIWRNLPMDEWAAIPGRHADMQLEHASLTAILNMPDNNTAQQEAKWIAYCNVVSAVVQQRSGWSTADLLGIANNNADAVAAKADLDQLISDLGYEFPKEI